jgi:general stress protein 26
MHTTNHPTPELRRLAELIDGQRIAMLTTQTADGGLDSRPMTVVDFDADGHVWLFCHHDPADTEFAERHRRVNLAFSDERTSTFLSIPGRAKVVHDPERLHALWSPALKPWFPEGPDAPHLGLLRITPERAEYWDAPDSRVVRGIALAVSIAAGKPVGLGEHGVLSTPFPASMP